MDARELLKEGQPLAAFTPHQVENLSVGADAVAKRTSKTSAKVAKKAAAKRVAAEAAKPRRTAPKSQSRKVAKPTLLAGGNPQIAKAYGDAPV
jgi:predicted DNA-binding transcriptional regulator YafY